jgi:membrane-associated PAP2 superfamily phosphatase
MSANPNRFMLWHAWIPFAAFAALAILLSTTDLDLRIADHFFYDFEAARWVGKDTWWARNVLHTGGRNVMRAAGIFGLLALGASYVAPLARRWPALVRQRRPLGFFVACVAIVPLVVGSLKQITNVDCPWDLAHYGGERPFVHIFEDRPDDLPRAACFPGAHSSSGFALLGLYFLGLARSRRHALTGLAIGIGVGSLFSFAQQARGAHFLSHDLWSAFIAWGICLALYRYAWRENVNPAAPSPDSSR